MTLIGATTENPYFEVNSALLSRCSVIALEPLTEEELAQVVGAGQRRSAQTSPDEIVARHRGSAPAATRAARCRRSSSQSRPRDAEGVALEARHVDDAARKRPLHYDRAGDQHYDYRLGVHQVDAWRRRGCCRLLPRRDARGGRGRAVHRAAHGHPRLGGRRQRRSAGARRRGRGGARRRARRSSRKRSSTSRRRRSTSPGHRSRTPRRSRSGRHARTSASTATLRPPASISDSRSVAGRCTRARRRLRLPARRPERLRGRRTSPRRFGDAGTIAHRETARRASEWRSRQVTGRPTSTWRRAHRRTRVRLSDYPRPDERPPRLPPVRVDRRSAARRRSTSRRTSSRSASARPRSCSSRATPRPRGRHGSRSSAPSTRSRPTSGRTAPPRRRTACSTRRRAHRFAARS